MADPATEFEHQLETFRVEAEAATQFFYAYLAVVSADAQQSVPADVHAFGAHG